MDYSNEIAMRGTAFGNIKGRAVISCEDGSSAHCDFELVQYQKGDLLAFCSIDLQDVRTVLQWDMKALSSQAVSFEGTAENGLHLELLNVLAINTNIQCTAGQPVEVGLIFIAPQAHFKNNSTLSPNQFFCLRFPLVNLELPPAPPIDYSDPAGNLYNRSVIKLEADGRSFYFEPAPESSAILKELEHTKGTAVTAYGFTFFTKQEELAEINKILTRLNIVMTFMQGTLVNRLSSEIISADGVVREAWWYDAVTRPYSTSTLVNRLLAKDVRLRLGSPLWEQCIQTMFVEFCKKNNDWNLTELISAFNDATTEGTYLELRGLKICGCAEILRARFLALNNETYLTPAANFEAIVPELKLKMVEALGELLPGVPLETIRAMSSHLRGLNYSPFRGALRKYCKQMTYEVKKSTPRETKKATDAALSAFIASRNALVHYGRFAVPKEPVQDWTEERIDMARWQQYQFIERLTAGMLASLMGWMQVRPETQMPEAPDFFQE